MAARLLALGKANVASVLMMGHAQRQEAPPSLPGGKLGNRAQNLETMAERSDTEVFQVLVCQIAEDREIDMLAPLSSGEPVTPA